jgi:hypothetical protein
MASRKRAATAVEPDDDTGCAFLHELSGEEQLRLRNRHLERKRKEKKLRDKGIRRAASMRTEEQVARPAPSYSQAIELGFVKQSNQPIRFR